MFGAVFWGKKLYMDPIWQMTSIWAMSWAMYGAVFWNKKLYMDPIFLCMVNYVNLGYVLGYGLGYGLGCDLGKEPLYGFYTVNLDRNEPLNRLMPEIRYIY